MATCTQCKTALLEDSDGITVLKCDICMQDYCATCFPLASSELRVVPLKKRVLMICCPSCKPISRQALFNAEKVRHLEEEITLLKKNLIDKDVIISSKSEIINLLQAGKYSAPTAEGLNPSILKTQSVTDNTEITLNQVNTAVNSAMEDSVSNNNNRCNNLQAPVKEGGKKRCRSLTNMPSLPSEPNKIADLVGVPPTAPTTGEKNNIKLSGVPKKTWYHISRVSRASTSKLVAEFVKTRTGITRNDHLFITQLNTKGDTNSFKVGVDNQYSSQIEKEDFWPENIVCRSFVFNRRNEYTNERHNRGNFRAVQGGRRRY